MYPCLHIYLSAQGYVYARAYACAHCMHMQAHAHMYAIYTDMQLRSECHMASCAESVHIAVCVDMCAGTCGRMRLDMCVDTRAEDYVCEIGCHVGIVCRHPYTRVRTQCMVMGADMCVDMRIDMPVGMCVDMCIDRI